MYLTSLSQRLQEFQSGLKTFKKKKKKKKWTTKTSPTLGNLVTVTLNEQRLSLDCLNEAPPPPFFTMLTSKQTEKLLEWKKETVGVA